MAPSDAITTSSSINAAEPIKYIDREHTWGRYVFISVGLSMCIFVDIFQYSMPLAFLPSVLEDRGHSAMNIATAIGVYYWTGFLGGLVLTSYQIWRVLYVKEENSDVEDTPYETVVRHIKFLIVGLAIATVTLFFQALHPHWEVHVCCRFIQGFVGAYIFFYAFLLCVAVFKGQQQVTAMTFASMAVVVAEVFGSFLGAVLFDLYGQRAVFWFLGFVSCANQGYLFAILYMVRPTEKTRSPRFLSPEPAEVDPKDEAASLDWRSRIVHTLTPQPGALAKFKVLLQNRQFACANLLITMSACIKGSVEEMLPFHGDHQWGYDPLQIGQLFCTIAAAYMVAAALVSQSWTLLGRAQVGCSSVWLLAYGVTAWLAFSVASWRHDSRVLTVTLAAYGFACGLAFTAAAQLIADVIDHEEGSFKEASNGIWNATWEAGGSLGFFLGGLLAEHYPGQRSLLWRYVIGAIVTAMAMVAVGCWPVSAGPAAAGKLNKARQLDYGSAGTA